MVIDPEGGTCVLGETVGLPFDLDHDPRLCVVQAVEGDDPALVHVTADAVPGDALVGVLLGDPGVELPGHPADLRDPVVRDVVDLGDGLDAPHEVRERLELRPLVVRDGDRHVHVDGLNDLTHVGAPQFSSGTASTEGPHTEARHACGGCDADHQAHRGNRLMLFSPGRRSPAAVGNQRGQPVTLPQSSAVPMWGGGAGDPIAQGPHSIVFQGSSFCLSEPDGDVLPGRPQGYFRHDTRLVSRWELVIDGRRPEALTRFSVSPHETRFVQRMPPVAGGSDTALLVDRHRRIGSRLTDELRLRNLSAHPVSVAVTLRVDSDFADIFAVKEGRTPTGRRTVSVRPTGALVLRGDEPGQGVKVSMSGASYSPEGLRAEVVLDPFGSTVLVAEAQPTSPRGMGIRPLAAGRVGARRRSTLSTVDPETSNVLQRSSSTSTACSSPTPTTVPAWRSPLARPGSWHSSAATR